MGNIFRLGRFIIVESLVWIMAALAPPSVLSSTFCEQSFRLTGKTTGEISLLVVEESVDGECQYTNTLIVALSKSGCYPMVAERLPLGHTYADSFPRSLIRPTTSESADTIVAHLSGSIELSEKWSLQSPLFDSGFAPVFGTWPLENEEQWKRSCLDDCIDVPRFQGCEAQLLHATSGGLYKNYTIDTVWFFPSSRILVVIANQPRRKPGMDTMHGLLIYELRDDSSQTWQCAPVRETRHRASSKDYQRLQFELSAKSAGENSFVMLTESWENGALPFRPNRRIFTLFLRADAVQAVAGGLTGNRSGQLFANLPQEDRVFIPDSNGRFQVSADITFVMPSSDTTWRNQFYRSSWYGATMWDSVCPADCIDLPVFTGGCAELIYTHPTGLYRGYEIGDVYFYPKSQYLFIFTRHQLSDWQNRSMHGLLIYQLDGHRDWKNAPCRRDKK